MSAFLHLFIVLGLYGCVLLILGIRKYVIYLVNVYEMRYRRRGRRFRGSRRRRGSVKRRRYYQVSRGGVRL